MSNSTSIFMPGEIKIQSIPASIHAAAYKAHCEIFAPNSYIANGDRPFTTKELISLLYARCFSRTQWADRFAEGMREIK